MNKTYELKYGKVVEDADGVRTYVKCVNQNHLMRKFNAWGFQLEEVGRMKNLNVSKIVLHVKYDGTYETDMLNLKDALQGNFGFGNQAFVPTEKFKRVN